MLSHEELKEALLAWKARKTAVASDSTITAENTAMVEAANGADPAFAAYPQDQEPAAFDDVTLADDGIGPPPVDNGDRTPVPERYPEREAAENQANQEAGPADDPSVNPSMDIPDDSPANDSGPAPDDFDVPPPTLELPDQAADEDRAQDQVQDDAVPVPVPDPNAGGGYKN